MKKLRIRLYIALLPLQLLLVALAVWAFFVLANLGTLVVDDKGGRRAYARNLDNCLFTLREFNFVLETSAKAGGDLMVEDLQRIAQKYFANCDALGETDYIDSNEEIAELWTVNEQLSPRIQRLLDDPNDALVAENLLEIGKLSREAERRLENAAESSVEEILNIQGRFRERIQLSFYVLGLGVCASVVATILISLQIGRMILNPLEQLEARLDDVSRGNLDAEVGVVRSDEIGRLATTFNQMVGRLREYRALTDQRLMNLTRTFRSVLERNPHPIIFLQHDLQVFFANPPARELLDAPELENGLPDPLRELIFQALEDGDLVLVDDLGDTLRFNVAGQKRFFLAGAFPIDLVSTDNDFDNGPESEGIALLLQDVTRMKLADDIKGNLVATVSHELKTPLTSARMSLYLLSEQSVGELNDDQLELVETAKEDLERQLATIQNLLDLSRIEQGASALERKPCAANKIAVRSLQAHADLAKTSGVTLTSDLTPDNPLVNADAKRIEIVLNNLLSNALRHAPEHSEIVVQTETRRETVRFAVADQGPGVPDEFRERIFDRYAQGSDSQNHGSAGLGLNISREIINDHGGDIGFDSVLGEGSVFFFELPRIHPPGQETGEAAAN